MNSCFNLGIYLLRLWVELIIKEVGKLWSGKVKDFGSEYKKKV